MVPVTLLVEKITKGKELQNILARQCAGTENSCSSWQLVPGFLFRGNHFPSEEETTLRKIKDGGKGKEELSWVNSAWGSSPGAEPATQKHCADRPRRRGLEH